MCFSKFNQLLLFRVPSSFPYKFFKKYSKENMFNNSLQIRYIGINFVFLGKNILKLFGKRFGV